MHVGRIIRTTETHDNTAASSDLRKMRQLSLPLHKQRPRHLQWKAVASGMLIPLILVGVLLPFGTDGHLPLKSSQQQSCDKTRRVFNESYGEISDGPSGYNYTQDSHCEWLIKAQNESQFITLTFRSMGTECSYDYIFIYDGDSFRSPLLGSFSGKTEPQRVVASSGSMLVLLYSDTNYVLEGFKAEFAVSNCPNNCTDHGKCVGHTCVCDANWIGDDCSQDACPDGCGQSDGRGNCVGAQCICSSNYSGQSCSLHKTHPVPNEWHWLSNSKNGLTPRATHTAVYYAPTDSLYVFGGYNLNKVLGSLNIYRFNTSRWENEWGVSLGSEELQSITTMDGSAKKGTLFREQSEDTLGLGLGREPNFFNNFIFSLADNKTGPFGAVYGNTSRPSGRYGHAACAVGDGFVIFGGKLAGGRLSADLWLYNISENGGTWSERARRSSFQPPPLTRHTLTAAGKYLYAFGGALENGEFSSRLFRIQLSKNASTEQWEEVFPRGGKTLDLRIVAHTTSYHKHTNSLIVYGGVVAGVARFSKLSDRLFTFQLDHLHWTEIMYPRTPLRDAYIPRERAFHTTTINGNYLIVFGGYTHRHNKEEICYDNQMYLYHLGCHNWISQDVLGKSRYPKQQGVFAHAAALRNGNTLLLVGGYHGNVNGDLLAYTLPPMLIVENEDTFEPEAACPRHASVTECLSDPECGWCSADGLCYGRTIGANCTTNLQTMRCRGICPALGDCHSCLIHGSSSKGSFKTIANKLGLDRCTWCVQNARCHHKDDNYGVCGEDTPSGWWGPKGTEVTKPEQCTVLDTRPGLTFLKYLAPINWSMPDTVMIVNATMVDFNLPSSTTHTEQSFSGQVVARLLGYIRPPAVWEGAGEKLRACASYSQAVLRMASTDAVDYNPRKKLVPVVTANITASHTTICELAQWRSLEPRYRVMVDFQAKRNMNAGIQSHPQQISKMGLQHSAISQENPKAFTFEFLEPYSNGSCSAYNNCLHCLSDSLCGWCETTNECISRQENETKVCRRGDHWRYLTVNPAQCSNCSNYISCEQCIDAGLCEWWAEDARCSRKGRSSTAVTELSSCPVPCYLRENCSSCLNDRGRCVWCEATSQCFSFSVYTSEYQFGLCREWLDQTMPIGIPQSQDPGQQHSVQPIQQCKSCASHQNCSHCLRSLSCGWCYDVDNPIEGACIQGDFNRSAFDCRTVLNTTEDKARWSYAQCPDVDECELGLHDCHAQAECINTHGSYTCRCRKGYLGDGIRNCIQTCYETCIHGYCSGGPEYKCQCDLGWTGIDCSQNCACNNHSTCSQGVGKCDKCMNWTEGLHCERCSPGSYGNATTQLGCQPCDCNGHGNEALGICDSQTGECYCQDNTEGLKCEVCNRNFYGDPKAGGQCYYQCEPRGVLTHTGTQGIGSHQLHKSARGGIEARECLWIISPYVKHGVELKNAIIQFEIEPHDMNVTCGQNAIYVYDGLPDLTGITLQKQLLAVFCNENKSPWITEARSGHLTVHYRQGHDQGFKAIYSVMSCNINTCKRPYICSDNKCVCPKGFTGPRCSLKICPSDCNAEKKQGVCDAGYGRCICAPGFGDADCSRQIKPSNIVFTELFNSYLISDSFEHLRKTLPRFGHTLVADRRGSLWMFGGYSLSHGPLNDIRQFDTKNNTWMQVTVDSSPEDRMPLGRYFHAAEMILSKQAIYIYGGLSRNQSGHLVLDDFWQFGLQSQRWSVVHQKGPKPPPLAGHSMTLIKEADKEVLLVIGGFSVTHGLSNYIWMFDLSSNSWSKVLTTGGKPVGIFGHSATCHLSKMVVYLYGGIVYSGGRTRVSNKMYALNFKNFKWTELPVFANRPSDYIPQSRYLHSAVTTENYMLIVGGRFPSGATGDALVAYVYKCNQWIRLSGDIEIIGSTFGQVYAQAMTQDPEYDAFFAVGGWDGSSYSRVTKIDIPGDLCDLWSGSKYICRQYMGCSFCAIKTMDEYTSHCYAYGNSDVCDAQNGTLSFNNGAPCDDEWLSKRNCSLFDSCGTCLATYPFHSETQPACQWCPSCGSHGKCISYESNANHSSTATTLDSCPSVSCTASDCESCNVMPNCTWTLSGKYYKCQFRNDTDGNRKPSICPVNCHTHTSCSTCLSQPSSEGGWSDCRWSTQLNECISPSYQPLYCAGSICGLVLEPSDVDQCPEPCGSFLQCATCLRHAHCGWCSRNGTEGDGVCTEGSLDSPVDYPASSTCDVIYRDKNNITTIDLNDRFSWNYIKCPPENECANSHHNCNVKSERCVDLLHGYECQCAEGYRGQLIDSAMVCIPVCKQGCVRGSCVEPDRCDCDFGYVGANCSIQCQCNGHSNCAGPDRLDSCLHCHNNTLGVQCEKCMPFFVRDSQNGGECVPCSEYCHGHTDICVGKDLEPSVQNMSYAELTRTLTEGPQSDAMCLRCSNFTDGDRCETCIPGYFRGANIPSDPCRRCQCHGHGDMCDPVTGEKCNCGNNTESDNTCSAKGKNLAYSCWSMQCTKCKDSYSGHPSNGHQCYKHITVDSRMCFDAKSIDECKIKPQPLKPGQTVFFVIQPRYMNVDIRFIVDVTQGELDFYMSPNDESFVVQPNNSSGYHDIYLDNRYSWHQDIVDIDAVDGLNFYPLNINRNYSDINMDPPLPIGSMSHSHCRMDTEKFFYVKDKIAKDLITYVTLQQCNSLLRVFGLKNRLVVTLPHTVHSLGQTKFYIALRARAGSNASYGLVFFRQDQLHIHLFVFFSVFFSCFFLFLAICVLAWKAKQAADMRRARRRHVVEMLHMAKRPFGRINLSLETPSETPASNRKRGRSKQPSAHHLQQDIAPVALEPTVDNVAAVGTVFVRLPGKHKSQVSLALASSLVVLTRNHTTYNRAFQRRRGSSHYMPPNLQQGPPLFVDLPQEQVPLQPLALNRAQ